MHPCSLIPHALLLLAGYAAVQAAPAAWANFPEQVSRGALLLMAAVFAGFLAFIVAATVSLHRDIIADLRKEVRRVQGEYGSQRERIANYKSRAEGLAIVLAWERRRADEPDLDLPITLSDCQAKQLERLAQELHRFVQAKRERAAAE